MDNGLMLCSELSFLNEEFHVDCLSPDQLDRLLADGWRHFGTKFFRYNFGLYEWSVRRVIPLRIRLSDFSFSKSQRRVLRKNHNLRVVVGKVSIDHTTNELFDRHKRRFSDGIPDTILDFLGASAGAAPVLTSEMRVLSDGDVCAISYFDEATDSISGVYAMFEPRLAARSLGIFTLLKEIAFAADEGMRFYYLGYAYEGRSFYDYKKRFCGLEAFDWRGKWLPYDGA